MTRKIVLSFAALGLIVAVNGAVSPAADAAFSTKTLVTFDGPAFGPKDLVTSDGPAFGPKDIMDPQGPAFDPSGIRGNEGPANREIIGGNQR